MQQAVSALSLIALVEGTSDQGELYPGLEQDKCLHRLFLLKENQVEIKLSPRPSVLLIKRDAIWFQKKDPPSSKSRPSDSVPKEPRFRTAETALIYSVKDTFVVPFQNPIPSDAKGEIAWKGELRPACAKSEIQTEVADAFRQWRLTPGEKGEDAVRRMDDHVALLVWLHKNKTRGCQESKGKRSDGSYWQGCDLKCTCS